MIRTIDMQSVLTQSTATEKVNQTQQQNQDMQARHFTLVAEEVRERQGTSVTVTPESGNVRNQVERDKRDSHGKKRRERESGDHSHSEESERKTGNVIDITI